MDAGRTIPWRDLPSAREGATFSVEWDVYRENLPQLLANGHDGKFVLIEGSTLVGVFASWDEARKAGIDRFALAPFFVHAIRSEEPILRIRGFSLPIHRLHSQVG